MSIRSSIKHALHCTFLILTIVVSYYTNGRDVSTVPGSSPGLLVTVILTLQQWSFVLCLPITALMFLGLVLFNAFPDEIKVKDTSKRVPFVCIRTVTRGLFPELVLENVNRNMKTCFEAGLENFVVEVVTDKKVGVPPYPRLREIVVPTEYKTKNGTLYKARALQYCLEEGVNSLSDEDWVVHLDEETVMTPGSVRGIVNFIQEDKHQLGQGMITYANENVVNWITTLADTTRIADDLGILRFQLQGLHKLLLSWKGSYLVIKACVERKITFDHGPKGSITEDINFGMLAASQGYTFNFIQGEMWEKSTFTLADFIRQRARWSQGSLLITLNKNVPYKAKMFLCYCTWLSMALPFVSPTMVLTFFFPMSWGTLFGCLRSFVVGIFTYTFVFGILRTFSLTRMGIVKYAACLIFSFVLLPPIKIILDAVAIAKCLFTPKLNFHVVDKKTVGTTGANTFTV